MHAVADRTVRRITAQNFERNRSLQEMRALARSAAADPLKEFGEACRKELEELRKKA